MINKIYFDGGSALHMICIYDESRKEYFTEKINTQRTNNELEYLALRKAVTYANNYYSSLSKVLFLGDSELIIKQMIGENKIRKSHLKKLYDDIIKEIKSASLVNFESNFKWIPRNENLAGLILEDMLVKFKKVRYNV